MKKTLISSMLLMSGLAASAASSGTGVMTAIWEYGVLTKEEKTFQVKGSYENGVLSVSGIADYAGQIRFYVDLVTGDVDTESNRGSSDFSDARACDYKIYGEIYNTQGGGSEMILAEFGKYTNGQYGTNFYNGTYVDTKIVFDFPITDLAEPVNSGILGEWEFELGYYPYHPPTIIYQNYKASLKNGYVVFTPYGATNTAYNLPITAAFNPDTNVGYFGSSLVDNGYMGAYDVFIRGIHFIDWGEYEFEGGSFVFSYDANNRCIEFGEDEFFQWLFYTNGKYHMEAVPYMLMYAEQLIDGQKRYIDIADINESNGVFTVSVEEFGMPDPSKIKVYYRLSAEGDFIEAAKSGDLTYTFDLNGLGLVPEMTYNVYIFAESGRTSTEIAEFAYTVGADNSGDNPGDNPGTGDSGVESVAASNQGARYFSLLGEEIKSPAPGTMCIKVEGKNVTKIIVK